MISMIEDMLLDSWNRVLELIVPRKEWPAAVMDECILHMLIIEPVEVLEHSDLQNMVCGVANPGLSVQAL